MSAPGNAAHLTPAESKRLRAFSQMQGLRLQPVKQLPMTIFFLYMTGNDISIFTIMFLSMALFSPITALLGTSAAFQQFDEDAKDDKEMKAMLSVSKLMYAGSCLAAFSVALIKLYMMNLLPVCMMDWMSNEPVPVMERSFGAVFV